MYLDGNNLYGWAMTQYLPYSGFKWLDQRNVDRLDVNLISEPVRMDIIWGLVLNIFMKYIA